MYIGGENMKKIFIAVTAMLILAGCGTNAPTAATMSQPASTSVVPKQPTASASTTILNVSPTVY